MSLRKVPDKNLTDEPPSPPPTARPDDDESDSSPPSSPFPDTPSSEWEDEDDYMFVKSNKKRSGLHADVAVAVDASNELEDGRGQHPDIRRPSSRHEHL